MIRLSRSSTRCVGLKAPSRWPSSSSGHDNLMIAARQGSPLAVGFGKRRDVSGLGRHRAGAVHGHDQLSGGRRLGRADARGQWRCAIAAEPRCSVRSRNPWRRRFLVDKGNHRHFMAKEIHEQPEVISHTLANYVDFAAGSGATPAAAVRFRQACPASPSRPAAPPPTPGLVAKYWFERYARLPVEIDIASEFRYREAPLDAGGPGAVRVAVRRDGRHAGRAALLPGRRASTSFRSSMFASPPSRANRTPCFRPWPGLRSGSPRPRRSPAS